MSIIDRLLSETKDRMQSPTELPFEYQYKVIYKHLSPLEKQIMEVELRKFEWSNQSIRMFNILQQEINIFSMTQYLLSIEDNNFVQLIMNDLLETEYSTLLAEVIHSAIVHKVDTTETILSECFKCAISDLIQSPNIIKKNYLHSVIDLLSLEEKETVTKIHRSIFYNMEECSITVAMQKQPIWIVEENKNVSTILNEIMIASLSDFQTLKDELLTNALKHVSSCYGWRYYLQYIKLLFYNKDATSTLSQVRQFKVHLKEMLINTIRNRNEHIFVLMLITARQISSSVSSTYFTYTEWYKSTIGEMRYNISKEDFIYVIELLTKNLCNETDMDILRVHATVAIPAPPNCNDFVLTFKQLTRNHMLGSTSSTESEPNNKVNVISPENFTLSRNHQFERKRNNISGTDNVMDISDVIVID